MSEFNLNNRTVLLKVADPVTPEDKSIPKLIALMTLAMSSSKIKAAGLAAPQIGVSKRVIIIASPTLSIILINPVITRRRLGQAISIEECLSYPGLKKKIKRSKQIIVEGVNEDWKPVKLKLRGFDAYVVQHEIDHLNGVTIKNKRQS